MLFFSQGFRDKKIKNATLQVRIPRHKAKNCEKRAFPSVSRAFRKKEGSLTVEASFVLPLFLFAMVTMMMPFSMMNRQRQMQAAVESVCEDISRLTYVSYELEHQKTAIKLPEEGLGLDFDVGIMEKAAVLLYAEAQIRRKTDARYISRLTLMNSRFLEDGETVELVADYELKLPFPIFRLTGVPATSQSLRRAWIGKEGGWLLGENGEEQDEIVYVGKGSTRYHISRTCHYLYNQLTKVSVGEVEQLRNASGGKYYPCARCKGGIGAQVYIMPSGTSYHSTSSCSAIIAYVKAVKKSEVAHLGACSYCR